MSGTRFFWDSIRWRAALLTSALVAVVLTVFTWYTVGWVEAALVARGITRAETATTVLAAQTAQTTQQGLARVDQLARDATVRACLLSPNDATRRAAMALVHREGTPGQAETMELWDANRHLVADASWPEEARTMMPSDGAPTAVGLRPLETHGDTLFTRTVSVIPGDSARREPARLGYLVVSHVIRASGSSSLVNDIVGNGATVLVGNQSGTVWTDLGHIVPAPPLDLSTPGGREFRASNGEEQIGASAPIAGTPWVLAIAFPRNEIVAPARQLLRRLLGVGLVFLVGATAAASTLSRGVTKPLGELRLAAQAIERGDYSRRVVTSSRDEVGQLGHAFNAMAEQVEGGRATLETRAAELAASREAARHANQVKDEFLAVLSHELRTPLSAMLGWCQMLREGVVPADRTGHALRVIERNALAQLRLVEDLLDVSRIVAGKIVLEMQPVDPVHVVNAAIESIQPMASAKEIAITVDVDPAATHAAGFVNGDPGRLQQAIWNLLSNAVKFTPRRGAVGVSVGRTGSSVQIVVRDNGEGISAQALPLIFDRLQQGEGAMKRRHSGLGLGLAIVRQVIDLHDGTVTAESDGPGRGATFRIELPVLATRAPGAIPAAKHPPTVVSDATDPGVSAVRGIHVLVVEDADDARELLSDLLTGHGAVVTAVRGPDVAVGWVAQNRPDVIISDIEMPGQDGCEMMRTIRASSGGVTPAIALTAYATPEDRDRSLASGFQAHLIKPVDLTELLRVISSLAGSAPAQSAISGDPASHQASL